MKKTIAVILSAALVLCMLPAAALSAAGSKYNDGTLEYTELADGTLSVTKYLGGGNITIPSSYNIGGGDIRNVTAIGSNAFSGNSTLTSVIIPSSVTSISNNAFSYCYALTSVTLSDGLTVIGDRMFMSCSKLASVTIPSSVTSIGIYAFAYCAALSSVTLSDGLTVIGSAMFSGCNALTSVTIPSSVTSIGYSAFSYCNVLTSVTFSDGLTVIGVSMFIGCNALTSVTIPSSVTSIENGAFSNCTALTSVTLSDGLTVIGRSMFAYCSKLGSVTIPSSVTSIGAMAFYSCSSLQKATIYSKTATFDVMIFSSTSIGSDGIYGFSGSTAETYANAPDNSHPFHALLEVTYDSQGGSAVPNGYVEGWGLKLDRPDDPSRGGYVFGGWYKEAACTNVWNFDNDTVSSSFTLYAKWTPAYTVAFETNGGGTIASQTVAQGNKAAEPTHPTPRDGYTFGGWYKEPACTNIWNFNNDTVSYSMTLYAKWTANTYTVTFDKNAAAATGTMANQSRAYDDGLALTANAFSRTGYDFMGWSTDPAATTAQWTNGAIVNLTSTYGATVALYAVWGTHVYTVTFDKNAAAATGTMANQSRVYDDGLALTANAFSRTGYDFMGWSTDPAATTAEWTDGTTENLTSADGTTVALYAVWEAHVYTVTFDKNAASATGTMAAQGRVYDDGLALTANAFSRTGYDFMGWSTDPAATTAEWTDGTTDNLTSADGATVTLYAVWGAYAYTVTFDAEGGTVTPASQTKLYDSTYGKASDGTTDDALPTPTKKGYTFGGWWTGADGTGSEATDSTTVNTASDHTLYAKWTINSYTVTFKDWDGTVLKTQTVKYEKAATAPDDPERTGYTFTGWNQDFDEITYNMTVRAQYTINTYTVAFNTSGGSSVSSQNVKYGGSAAQPEAPEKDGYTFGGWYSDSSFNKAYDFSAKVVTDMILYSKWTEAADTAQKVAQSLTLETAFKFAEGDTWECVTSNFIILGGVNSVAQITWTSSNSDVVRIEQNRDGSATGIVKRSQNNDASVVITATITKGSDSVSKTFLLVIKRQGASKNETREVTERTASVNLAGNTNGQTETIYRTTLNDGTNIDYVTVTPETLQRLIESDTNSGTVVVKIDQYLDSPADEFAFEVSADTVSELIQSGMGVTLESPAGSITLLAEALERAAQTGSSLYFRIVPVTDESDEAAEAFHRDGAVFSLSNVAGQVFGTPKTIQTNMESFATTITLPLEGLSEKQLADEAFLKTLCVYVEHDDGTTELVYGTLVYTDDMPTGIQFDISKFSRFQVVSVEQTAATGPWIWIVCIAAGVLLVLIILLLVIIQRRRRQTQVQF